MRWRDLRRRALGMDVPVALALLLAFGASVFNTVRGSGQTYFDSVTMFIFFLAAGRYVELIVRQRSLSVSEAVARSLPATVSRLHSGGWHDGACARRVEWGGRSTADPQGRSHSRRQPVGGFDGTRR